VEQSKCPAGEVLQKDIKDEERFPKGLRERNILGNLSVLLADEGNKGRGSNCKERGKCKCEKTKNENRESDVPGSTEEVQLQNCKVDFAKKKLRGVEQTKRRGEIIGYKGWKEKRSFVKQKEPNP